MRRLLLIGAVMAGMLGLASGARANAICGHRGCAMLARYLAAQSSPPSTLTLVSPSGTPIGGKWQQWVDESRAPTISGTLTVDVFTLGAGSDLCSGAPDCSIGPFPGGSAVPEIWAGAMPPSDATGTEENAIERAGLYFELGHLFDWRYLTNWDRSYLAREWDVSHVAWWDSQTSLVEGAEDGLEAAFAEVYRDCAMGKNVDGGELVEAFAGGPGTPPPIFPQINTCVFIDHIAATTGASMNATVHASWNRPRR